MRAGIITGSLRAFRHRFCWPPVGLGQLDRIGNLPYLLIAASHPRRYTNKLDCKPTITAAGERMLALAVTAAFQSVEPLIFTGNQSRARAEGRRANSHSRVV